MNCKQGDLVRYVGTTPRPNAFGWIGRVVRRSYEDTEPAWLVDPPLPGGLTFWNGKERADDRVRDCNLRPIRPGDITDSEVRELYAPKLPEVA